MKRISISLIMLAGSAISLVAQTLPQPLDDSDYRPVDAAEAALGQLLFYDPILSGNKEVSCATCHHPVHGTSDGLSLGIGDGGIGLGPARIIDPNNPPEQRIPRNAPGLFNLGAHEVTVLFHDGRIEVDASRPSGLRTPMGAEMEAGFASLLSAQTMFPVLSADEMAGHYSENEIAQAVRQGFITGDGGAWDLLSARVAALPDYAAQFESVYGIQPADIHFTHISDAIAAFMELEWRSDTAPFDALLRGEADLPPDATAGLTLFYGKAGCASCHSGALLTDHQFHAMGQPQIGPGKAARFEDHARDEGRMRVTGNPGDAYAFRTPSLRNVALTGPYGHAGAYRDLSDFLRHHVDPAAGLAAYDLSFARLPDMPVTDDRIHTEGWEPIAASITTPTIPLTDAEIASLQAFLDTLTDPAAIKGRLGVPKTVPSGLPVVAE